MISVAEALSIISKISYTPNIKTVLLENALGLTLSDDIKASINMPPFRQSAMDGYALLSYPKKKYEVIGEVKAGDPKNYVLEPGQAIRIFTGARVPDNADVIVIQEHVSRSENSITIHTDIKKSQHIRNIGEQIRKGALALSKGTILTPAGIGFLAGLGIDKVAVYLPPSVAIITTGNELVAPGSVLKDGEIYESNSIQLETVLKQVHITKITKYCFVFFF